MNAYLERLHQAHRMETGGEAAGIRATGGDMAAEVLLDVRAMPPRERHPKIFRAWEALPVGATLRLVNDHDPKPLYYEFCAERKGEFEWTPVERGPERWSVEIRRVAGGTARGLVDMDQTVKEVGERYPETQKVFARYGLDLCCGGVHSIRTAADANGVDAERLLADLNAAAAVAAEGSRDARRRSRPDWLAAAPAREVDVREDLRRGREPFQKIMSAAAGVRPGEVLLVRTIFEPKPLYQVLGARGFENWPLRETDGDWKIYFRRPGAEADAGGRVHALDVCGLEPPEPMVLILSKLPELGLRDRLVVTHFREPVPLYAHLEEAGFDHSIEKLAEGRYRLTIRKKGG